MPLASMGEGGGDEGRDDPPAVLAGISQGIAGKVHAAALPRGIEQLGDRGLEALVSVGDDQLNAAKAALLGS